MNPTTQNLIRLDPDPCTIGWGPGCDSYTRGHLCDRTRGHNGQHRCTCGATKRGALPDYLDEAHNINQAQE